MMRAILFLLALLSAGTATAQTKSIEPPPVAPAPLIRAGSYGIQGTAPDGTTYQGALQLDPSGPQTWRMVWSIAGAITIGTGLNVGDRLVYGYLADGQVGTGIYEPGAYGRLVGRWTQGTQGGIGTEILLPR